MAEVSPGTVDRVIHKRNGVSLDTRERIEKIIEDFDYRPDILAGRLAARKPTRFLICMPGSVHDHKFWDMPVEGVQKALFELEHFSVDVKYIRFDQHSQDDFARKMNAVDPAEYDGIMFVPVFPEPSEEFLNRCGQAGVPVVQFNTRISRAEPDYFVGQDAFQSGLLGGKLMSYGLPLQRDILVINLSLRNDHYPHIVAREKGFRSYFEAHMDRARNLISVNIQGAGYDKVSDVLGGMTEKYDVAGIFVTNSRVHMVARYLAEQGMMSMRLIGYDLLDASVEYLKREYIDFLISQSPEEQTYLAMRNLFDHVVLKRDIPPQVLLPIDILTKENVDDYLGFQRREDPDV